MCWQSKLELSILFSNQLLFNPLNPDRSDENKIVYISKTGKRYHCTDKCGQMKSGSKKSLKEAKSLGYTACCICIKEGNVKSWKFIYILEV